MKELLTTSSGRFGFIIEFQTKKDLSNAKNLRLRIRNPENNDNDRKLTDAEIQEPKNEGVVHYTVLSKDFIQPGLYRVQLFNETDGIKDTLTDILKIRVKPSLDFSSN